LASVDGTDCLIVGRILPNGRDDPRMYSYKIRSSALRYEVAVSIHSSDIVWVAGPYLPEQWNDLIIFRHGLSDMLPPVERVEADNGYVGDCPAKCKVPDSVTTR
jgi:hypothetical protein